MSDFPLIPVINNYPLTRNQYIFVFITQIIPLILTLYYLIKILRFYIKTENLNKQIKPILIISSSAFLSRFMVIMQLYVDVISLGQSDILFPEILSNSVPFLLLYYSLISVIRIYITVREKIRIARFIFLMRLLIVLISLVITSQLILPNYDFPVILISIGQVFLLIAALFLIYVYNLLKEEKKEIQTKLVQIRLDLMRYIVTVTIVFYLTIPILLVALRFSYFNQFIEFLIFLLLHIYTGIYAIILALLSYWTIETPMWARNRYNLIIPS